MRRPTSYLLSPVSFGHAHSAMPLDEYARKRDFSKTPEPSGKRKPRARKTRKPAPLYFCVQKHLASRLHYDLRVGWSPCSRPDRRVDCVTDVSIVSWSSPS